MPKNFETDRTRHWRSTNLIPEDERTVSNIEEYGCYVISVKSDLGRAYGWSYTVGIYDTSGKPDLITVGLDPSVAHSCLNEAAKRLRMGIDLSKGRHNDLIGDVDCEFRSVDPKWVKHVMNWANWYYNGAEYPVLQVVYPDLQNNFPEHPDFNGHFKQPLMQPGAIMTPTEEDFWATQDPNSSLFDWKFPDPPHTGVYLSEAVHELTEPVTYVSHDPDGDWQFLGDSMSDGGGPVIVCFHHPIDGDPSLKELADLPIGWYAERTKPGELWTRNQHDPDKGSET
jgi:hypothetical protein